jgi:tRNA 2-thiouridine synthesizing protein A
MMNITVDAKGMLCPMPIIKLAAAIKTVPVGGTVTVIATDMGFIPDIKAWCKGMKHEIVTLDEQAGVITSEIRRTK